MAATLYVDDHQVNKLLSKMQNRLTAKNFDVLMRRTLKDVGSHTAAFTRTEIPKEYYIEKSEAKKGVKRPKLSGKGGNLECDIPIIGPKGHIGGSFPAMGSWYGWNPPEYEIHAMIVKGKVSKLPFHIKKQGGQPPFRNMGGGEGNFVGKKEPRKKKARKALNLKFSKHPEGTPGTLVFTRSGPAFRSKIHSVAGLSVAQMPMNRAAPAIKKEINRYGLQRAEHHFSQIFNG